MSLKLKKKHIILFSLITTFIVSTFYCLLYTTLPIYLISQYLSYSNNITVEYNSPNGYLLAEQGLSLDKLKITQVNNNNFKLELINTNLKLTLQLTKLVNYKLKFNIDSINLDDNIIYDIHGDLSANSYHVFHQKKPIIWHDKNSSKNHLAFTLEKKVKFLDFLPAFNKIDVKASFKHERIDWHIISYMDYLPSQSSTTEATQRSKAKNSRSSAKITAHAQKNYTNQLILDGYTNLKHYLPKESSFRLTTPSNTPALVTQSKEAEIYGIPNLKLDLDLINSTLDISGKINVTHGNIIPLSQTKIKPSDDVVIINKKYPENSSSRRQAYNKNLTNIFDNIKISTKLTIATDNNFIMFKTKDLKAKLKGEITLSYIPEQDKDIVAVGEINLIDSHYTIYGYPMKIKQGTLLYANNPIDNPSIKILGERQVQLQYQDRSGISDNKSDIPENSLVLAKTDNVGINISGTLNQPDIKLYASSPMSEADKISYLLFGVPSFKLSQAQGQIILQTAKQLFGSEDSEYSKISNKIMTIFSIDDISLENMSTTNSQSVANLIISKTFFKKLLIRYGVSITNPLSSVSAEYMLRDNLSLSAKYQGNYTGSIDIVYSKETDRLI